MQGSVAVLVPWDRHTGADACAGLLGYLPHVTDVTLHERGPGLVRVTGSRRRLGDQAYTVQVTVERAVFVK